MSEQPPSTNDGGTHQPARTGLRATGSRLGLITILAIVGMLFAAPLVWMLAVSLRPANQAIVPGLGVLPRLYSADGSELSRFDGDYWRELAAQAVTNYHAVWMSPVADFPLYLHNSVVIGLLSVVGMVISSAVVAFGFSRVRWRGRDAVFLLVLATLMIPQSVVMAPLYVLFSKLGWIGTFKPLWLPAWFGGAFGIFLFRQFFLTIPRELDEAARIDGCSQFGTFCRIILPLSKPAIIIVAIMQFVACWNDFLGPLLFLNHQDQYTLSLGLQMYQSQHGGTPWNLVMAASVLIVVPVLVLYVFTRRLFVGSAAGAGIKE